MIQLILTTIVTLFVLGVLRFVFGFKRDKAGNPRVAGVIVPEWVMYLGYFAIATITLEISWYLLEDLSLYYAYELKNYLETQGILYIVILVAVVLLLIFSTVGTPKRKK